MEKVTIQNRKGQNVVVLFEEKENSKGLVIGMHGLGGHKEQSPIKAMAEAFGDNDYDVVRFDATSSFGESDGEYEDATVTNNYEDLEDVIEWCKGQGWFKGPFVLVGHSLGSLCIILYTEKHPGEVKAFMSSAIAGKFREKREPSESLEKWKKDGIMITTGYDGRIKRLKWSFMEDYTPINIIFLIQFKNINHSPTALLPTLNMFITQIIRLPLRNLLPNILDHIRPLWNILRRINALPMNSTIFHNNPFRSR